MPDVIDDETLGVFFHSQRSLFFVKIQLPK